MLIITFSGMSIIVCLAVLIYVTLSSVMFWVVSAVFLVSLFIFLYRISYQFTEKCNSTVTPSKMYPTDEKEIFTSA